MRQAIERFEISSGELQAARRIVRRVFSLNYQKIETRLRKLPIAHRFQSPINYRKGSRTRIVDHNKNRFIPLFGLKPIFTIK